ncbi:hypothetical protein GCM10009733_060060 [Nonomuraea maheshkhaliensis]|uniref:protein-glutamate methylesterase n=1 Tax=Nonomuraea maheshkhaliensis TaxID=419590 RepID=A0ABN2FN89_9ACTN
MIVRDAGIHVGRFPIVAIVCSAGGLKAPSRGLSALPAGFPGAVIVLQHLAPDHKSLLAAILAQHTSLPVASARDGDPLTPGATAVHHFGGTVIATDAASTNHFAMPHACITRDEIVDHGARLDDVAPLPLNLVGRARHRR